MSDGFLKHCQGQGERFNYYFLLVSFLLLLCSSLYDILSTCFSRFSKVLDVDVGPLKIKRKNKLKSIDHELSILIIQHNKTETF